MTNWFDNTIFIWHDRTDDFMWHSMGTFGHMCHIRERIIANIISKLAVIRTANGYQTDIGSAILRVARRVDPEALVAGVITPKKDRLKRMRHGSIQIIMPLYIEAVVAHGAVNPSVMAERLMADLIEAITGIVWSMRFTNGSIEIKAGDTITGAASGATALIQAVTVLAGTWAGGDAAGTLTLRRVTGTFTAENLNVGSQTNVATIGAEIIGIDPIDGTTGGLADNIRYIRGGVNYYPEGNGQITGIVTAWDIDFNIRTGDPYDQ